MITRVDFIRAHGEALDAAIKRRGPAADNTARGPKEQRIERIAEAIHEAMNMALPWNKVGPGWREYVLGLARAAAAAEDAMKDEPAERPEPREWR